MAITASVSLFKNDFVAELSDGRQIERHDWREMAEALFSAGVQANAVEYVWRAGQRMITAGQQVAMRSEIRRQAHRHEGPSIAA
jgi:hypothetical protein